MLSSGSNPTGWMAPRGATDDRSVSPVWLIDSTFHVAHVVEQKLIEMEYMLAAGR